MKWRQIPKITASGKVKMFLQVKKWWMITWHDCFYFIMKENGDKYWHHLITDIDYPPEIDNVNKKNLYYLMFGFFFKI